jgi:hypothetical protein
MRKKDSYFSDSKKDRNVKQHRLKKRRRKKKKLMMLKENYN